MVKVNDFKGKKSWSICICSVLVWIALCVSAQAQTTLNQSDIVIDSPSSTDTYDTTVWFHVDPGITAQEAALLGLTYQWTIRGEGHMWTFKGQSGHLDNMPPGAYVAIVNIKDKNGRYYSAQTTFEMGGLSTE